MNGVMVMKLRLATVGLTIGALAVAGWAFPTGPPRGAEVSAEPVSTSIPVDNGPVLLLGPASAITAIDPETSQIDYRIAEAVLAPTQDRVYERSGAWVLIRDANSGERLGRVLRPAGMELQVASTSGELLAFATPAPDGASEWLPGGRSKTKIAIVSTAGKRSVRRFDLKGNFAVEAFATNDRELFLIEYLPSRSPWHYGLRRLILASGAIREIDRAKQGAPGEMNGTGRLAVFSPGGHELYTLYTQQGVNYTHVKPADADADEVYAFVHLLNLNGAWTHCIDLPAPFGTGAATTHAMAVSPDGTSLYVADPSSGGLALVDPISSLVTKSVTADLSDLRRGIAAAVGSDGVVYLAGRTKIFVFDGATLGLLRTLRVPPGRPGIAISSDGSQLFMSRGKRLVVLDAITGNVLDEVRLSL